MAADDWDDSLEDEESFDDVGSEDGGRASPFAFPYHKDGSAFGPALSALSSWSVLEALSPRTYERPRDIVEGIGSLVAVSPDDLPWREPPEPRQNYDTYYRVSLGSIDMRQATRSILDAFGWDEGSVPSQGSHALLGMILLDARGAPVASGTSVSSFGWALPLVTGKDLSRMTRWGEAEKDAIEALSEMLCRPDPKNSGKLAPLGWEDILKAHEAILKRFGLPEDLASPPGIGIRFDHRIRPGSVPSPYLLNSFLLGSIERAHRIVSDGGDAGPTALGAYMGVSVPGSPPDILVDRDALRSVLSPGRTPFARWPTPGGHPLVTLQQAAVNAALSGLDEGVLAVNGPPGTGKTTMIRDIAAGNLVMRALAMAEAEDPESLFTQVKVGGRNRVVYRLAPSLRGYEMIVASSNNKAVENVSRELPMKGAVDGGAGVPRYFGTTSDFLSGISLDPKAKPAAPDSGTWGLISAALGNSGNRSAFMEGFWWNEDHGLRTWLRIAKGENVKVTVTDAKGKIVEERPPHLLRVEKPPRDRPSALLAWKAVRKRFLEAHDEVMAGLQGLMAYEEALKVIPGLEAELAQARAVIAKAHESASPVAALAERLEKAEADLSAARWEWESHKTNLPPESFQGSGKTAREIWEVERDEITIRIELYARTCQRLSDSLEAERQRGDDDGGVRAAVAKSTPIKERLDAAKRIVSALAATVGDRAVDDKFFEAGHAAWNVASPWMGDALQAKRAALFGLAMEVHQAFALAASRPLLRNLSAYTELTGNAGSSDLGPYADELWSSLFLVVPVVSTTFASAGRMLDGLPPESLGWLIVDEAGQATPQAPVGALAVCRRALFVGDPLQVEPVTTLPRRLVNRICAHFSVDTSDWTAPVASAQALADRASPLRSTFDTVDGRRSVGMPLLVHRRCQEPMFGISNRIAYDGQMVHAAGPDRAGETRRSAWFDIKGSHEGKWCEAEGEFAAGILRRMTTDGRVPDVFFISPFRDVAANLRRRLMAEAEGFAPDAAAWVRDRVGTVHTFQGREAASVVLVLGAGEDAHAGARMWAARTPNIANVAVTRAKSRLYVVGSLSAWGTTGAFKAVASALPDVAVPVRASLPSAGAAQAREDAGPVPGLRGIALRR